MGRIWSFVLGFRSLVARLVPFERGGTKGAKKIWQWKVRTHCEFQRHNGDLYRQLCGFLARESVNSSPTLARQWWRHFRLSLSLSVSLSLSLSHRKYLTHNIGSAFALPIIQTERERDRERRKWRHHFRAKIGDEFTLSHAKNSHNWRWAYTFPCQNFALFVSNFTLPVSPFTERSPLWRWNSQRGHTFHCQKIFALFVPPLSNGTSRATSDRKPKKNDQILPSPILFFPSKNWIKLIPKTIGNRKRDCAWGGSGW